MDIGSWHCCAHWNENSASSKKQLHGTASGWIHGCPLWLETWLSHESFNGCLYSLRQAFSTSYDQGSQFPLGLTGWTRRCDSAEGRYDGFGNLGGLLAPFLVDAVVRDEGSNYGFSTNDDWMRTRLSSWPSRVFTMAAGDLNSGV